MPTLLSRRPSNTPPACAVRRTGQKPSACRCVGDEFISLQGVHARPTVCRAVGDTALLVTLHASCLSSAALLHLLNQVPPARPLPADAWNVALRSQRVELVLGQVGLSHVRGVIVGSPLRKGISGGERKRLCVGMELLTEPLVLFLVRGGAQHRQGGGRSTYSQQTSVAGSWRGPTLRALSSDARCGACGSLLAANPPRVARSWRFLRRTSPPVAWTV